MRDTVTAPGLSGEASGCAGVVDTTGGARGAQWARDGRPAAGGRRIQRDSSLGLGVRVVVRVRGSDVKPGAPGPSATGRSLCDRVAVGVDVLHEFGAFLCLPTSQGIWLQHISYHLFHVIVCDHGFD